MDLTRFAVRLHSPLPQLTDISTLGNDSLCVRVGHPDAIAFIRIVPPSYGLVMEAIESGLVEPLNLQLPSAQILAFLSQAVGAPPHGLLERQYQLPPGARPRHLLRLK